MESEDRRQRRRDDGDDGGETRPLLMGGVGSSGSSSDASIVVVVAEVCRRLSRGGVAVVSLVCGATSIVALIALIHALSLLSPPQRTNYGSLAAEIEAARRTWDVPGIAVAVVRRGIVEFADGFGSRDESASGRVTVDTAFEIGSMTKSFTAYVTAKMVDEGRLAWDAPVVDSYWRDGGFVDPVVAGQATLIDLLSHRTGLPRHDYFQFFDRRTAFDRIRFMQPTAPFRSKYQYNNLMVGLAGFIAANASGLGSWDALIQRDVFDVLGMKDSYTTTRAARNSTDNLARGFLEKGRVAPSDFSNLLEIDSPAGSIVSTVGDVAKWMTHIISKGRSNPNGTRTISEDAFNVILAPHTPISFDALSSYALCLRTELYKGRRTISHGGATFGFTSFMLMFPDDDLSIVVLTNSMSGLSPALAQSISDRILTPGQPSSVLKDAHARMRAEVADAERRKREFLDARNASWKMSLMPEDYVGKYTHPSAGSFSVFGADSRSDGTVSLFARIIDAGDIDYDATLVLDHWEGDSFVMTSDGPLRLLTDGMGLARFVLDESRSKVVEFSATLEPALGAFTFVKDA